MKAFPQLDSKCYDQFRDKGMDLRDYFAAKAMQRLISNEVLEKSTLETFCGFCYVIANAMMKAREQK